MVEPGSFWRGVAGLYRALWRYAAGRRPQLVAAMLLLVGAELFRLGAPWLAGNAINAIQQQGRGGIALATRDLVLIFATVLASWTLHGPARILERNVALHARSAYMEMLLQRLLRAPLAWHRAQHSAETTHRVTQSSEALNDFAENQYLYLQNAVVLIGPLVALWLILPVAGLAATIGFALLALISVGFDRALIDLANTRNEAERGHAMAWVDTLSNLLTIYALRRFDGVRQLIRSRIEKLYVPLRRMVWLNEAKWASVDVLGTLLSCGLVALYALFTLREGPKGGGLAIGSLYMVYEYSRRAETVMSTIAADFALLAGQQANFGSAAMIVDAPQLALPNARRASAWRTLSIDAAAYSADTGVPILSDLTITLEQGRRYALIGASGAGKSSLLRLLAGLDQVDAGTIRRDGTAIEAAQLREEATLIPQEAELFVGTVADNLTLGADVPRDRIQAALEAVQAAAFVNALPHGLQTRVEEGGANWSGGQRQRLALARGLIAAQGGGLILLDEPTTSLDAEAGARVVAGLLDFLEGHTVVVALHRLDLLDRFDRVLRVIAGRVEDCTPGAIVSPRADRSEPLRQQASPASPPCPA